MTNFVDRLVAAGVNPAFGLLRYGQSANSGNPIIENNGILTTDTTYFKNVIWARNDTSGGTEPGFFAVVEAVNKFVFRPGAQKIFIIITDEEPAQGNKATEQDAIKAAVGSGTRVFALTVASLFRDFEQLTTETSGDIFNILDDFDDILQRIAESVANTFLVRYRATDTHATATPRTVDIDVTVGPLQTRDTTIYTPRSTPRILRTPATIARHQQAQTAGAPVPIEVRILDAVPPVTTAATLFYRTTGSPGFSSVQMTHDLGDAWRALPLGRYCRRRLSRRPAHRRQLPVRQPALLLPLLRQAPGGRVYIRQWLPCVRFAVRRQPRSLALAPFARRHGGAILGRTGSAWWHQHPVPRPGRPATGGPVRSPCSHLPDPYYRNTQRGQIMTGSRSVK